MMIIVMHFFWCLSVNKLHDINKQQIKAKHSFIHLIDPLGEGRGHPAPGTNICGRGIIHVLAGWYCGVSLAAWHDWAISFAASCP